MKKKLLTSLGIVAALGAPIAVVVSCGSSSEENVASAKKATGNINEDFLNIVKHNNYVIHTSRGIDAGNNGFSSKSIIDEVIKNENLFENDKYTELGINKINEYEPFVGMEILDVYMKFPFRKYPNENYANATVINNEITFGPKKEESYPVRLYDPSGESNAFDVVTNLRVEMNKETNKLEMVDNTQEVNWKPNTELSGDMLDEFKNGYVELYVKIKNGDAEATIQVYITGWANTTLAVLYSHLRRNNEQINKEGQSEEEIKRLQEANKQVERQIEAYLSN